MNNIPEIIVRSTHSQNQGLSEMNTIMIIHPYKYHGTWVFDDENTGLVREPFVLGIDTMIDMLVSDLPDASQGFNLLFSDTPFPGDLLKLEWVREESGGNWYYARSYAIEGWLCPALLKYFQYAPVDIYVKAIGATK